MCQRSELLCHALTYPSRLLVSVTARKHRFLTYVDFGSLALLVKCFRGLLAALLPHDATTRQRNGWPSLTTMRGFCCCASHIHSRGNMRASGASVFSMPLSTARDRAIAASLGISAVFPWQPGGDPIVAAHDLTHLLILVCLACAVASTSNSASCINGQGPTQRKLGKYTHMTFVCVRQRLKSTLVR